MRRAWATPLWEITFPSREVLDGRPPSRRPGAALLRFRGVCLEECVFAPPAECFLLAISYLFASIQQRQISHAADMLNGRCPNLFSSQRGLFPARADGA
jgi:hypothetical protein